MKFDFHKFSQSLYASLGYPLALGAAFLLPLKLSLCFGALIPLVLLWAGAKRFNFREVFNRQSHFHLLPYVIFLAFTTFSSLFGIDVLHSLRSIISLAFFSLTALVVADLTAQRGIIPFIVVLILGQSLAALQSVLNGAYPQFLPEIFLGKVTESGQLAITFVMGLGTLFYLSSKEKGKTFITPPLIKLTSARILALITSLVLGALAFSNSLSFSPLEQTTTLIVTFAIMTANFWYISRLWLKGDKRTALAFLLLVIALPLMMIALLINLKRGPWAGVIVAASLLFAMFSRRMIAPMLVVTLALFCLLSPIRSRLLQSYEHFSISGGRQAIWDIGAELSLRYPLGIGFKNSPVLRKFSTEIPPQLRHFHNNLLNVTVESGWIGLCLFLWWLGVTLRASWSLNSEDSNSILTRTIGCAIISWQVAGIVEYNFGDTEVLIIVFILLGWLSALKESALKESALGNAETNYPKPSSTGSSPVSESQSIYTNNNAVAG